MTPLEDRDEAVRDLIRTARMELLRAGFVHANSAGELRSADQTTWLSTTYTHGEYSVYVWRRPRGHGEIDETKDRSVVRITFTTDLEEASTTIRRLKRWAKKPPVRGTWPPKGFGPLR